MPSNEITSPYTRRLRRATLCGLSVLLLFVALAGNEPASKSGVVVQLSPDSTASREFSPGVTEVFEIVIESGKLLRFSIDKGDLVLSTSVYGPTGMKLLETVSQELEIVEVSLPADLGGNYKIELQPRETLKEPRPYQLKVEPFAPVTANGRRDSDARRLLAEGEISLANWTAADLRQARDKFDHAAKIWTTLNDFSNASLATLKAGDVCFRLSEFAEALKHYRNADAFAHKNGNSLWRGKALGRAAIVYSYLGDNDQAQNHANTALNVLKSAATDPNPFSRSAYGEALASLAEVTYARGIYPIAFQQFKEASSHLSGNRKAQANVHRFLGYLSGTVGDAAKAKPEISQAQELSQAINDKPGEGLALTALGTFYTFDGKPDIAIDLQRQAMEIFHSTGDRYNEGLAFLGLGAAYQKKFDFPNAIINTEKALGLFESMRALDAVAVATFKLGNLYTLSGKHEEALGYFDRSLTLSRAAKKVRNEANVLSQIAMVYASQKRSDLAERQIRKARKFYESIGDFRGQAVALNRYGTVQLRIAQKQQALETFTAALPLSEKIGDKDILTTTLIGLARAHQALRQP